MYNGISSCCLKVYQTIVSVCDVPQSVGPCVNSKRRWYYDQKKMRCRKFDKKGCAANKEVNGFESRKKCRKLTKSCGNYVIYCSKVAKKRLDSFCY